MFKNPPQLKSQKSIHHNAFNPPPILILLLQRRILLHRGLFLSTRPPDFTKLRKSRRVIHPLPSPNQRNTTRDPTRPQRNPKVLSNGTT